MALVSFREAELEFVRGYWTALMAETNGNIARAARIAQMERKNIYKILERHGIKRPNARTVHRGNWHLHGL